MILDGENDDVEEKEGRKNVTGWGKEEFVEKDTNIWRLEEREEVPSCVYASCPAETHLAILERARNS